MEKRERIHLPKELPILVDYRKVNQQVQELLSRIREGQEIKRENYP